MIPKLTRSGFLKVSCTVESATYKGYFTVTAKSIAISGTLNGSFTANVSHLENAGPLSNAPPQCIVENSLSLMRTMGRATNILVLF